MARKTTQQRILDAAEALFAEQGFTATSLRNITARAGANLAAVNYHFGSKEELIRQVFARRLEPLNRKRLENLTRFEKAAPKKGPTLEQIVEAFVGPALRMSHDPGGAVFMRLFGFALSQRDDRIRRMFTDQFRTVVDRFSTVLMRALPGLPPGEVFWRMLFMVGAMAHTMALSDKLPELSGGLCDDSDVEATIRRLVPFVVAGLGAPLPKVEAGGVP